VHPLSDDARLISLAKAGDIEAFGELYTRYLDPIFRYIRTRVSEDQTAEDLTEEAFLRAFKALGKYKERGLPFSAYLYRVTKNLLADYYRKHKEETALEDAHQAPAPGINADEKLIRAERYIMLGRAYAQLPDDYQEVIRLRVILGISTSEAATWMNRSEGALRVLLHRALKALREQMLNDG
jgi:RNA polymerase sigma-70 factor, ECF subfamily